MVQLEYTVQDHLSKVTDGEGGVTILETGDRDLQIKEVSEVSGETSYAYNEHGILEEKTDARGITVTYTNDALDRTTFDDYPGSELDVTRVYDDPLVPFSKGRMTAIERNGHEIALRYDRFGRMTQDGAIRYVLDANGNRAEIEYPGGVRAIYSHDYADREATLELAVPGEPVQPVVESASYLPFGPLETLELGNGLTETHTFDERYYPERITVAGGSTLLDWQYTTDDVGNPTAIADQLDPLQNRSYGYQDYQYYLSSGVGPWGNLAWLYDKIGNRLSETRGGVADVYSYVANAASGNTAKLAQIQLGAGGSRVYGFDAGGYQQQVTTSGDVVSYHHDAAGQLGAIDRPAAGVQAAMSYDGRGFLRSANELHPGLIFGDDFETGDLACWSAVVGGAGGGSCPLAPSVEPVYSSEGVLQYQLKEGGLERYVLYFAGRPVLLVALPAVGLAEVTWLAADHLGTPILASNSAGVPSWAGGFEPFGADFSGAQAAGVYLRFPGQWGDESWEESASASAADYSVFRWYERGVARYSRPDPLGLQGGVNRYAYAAGNPVNLIDPLGLMPKPLHPSRQANRRCKPRELVVCAGICGPKGVESCRISRTFRPVRVKDGKELWKWVDGPMSCSCNEPDEEPFCSKKPGTCAAVAVGVCILFLTPWPDDVLIPGLILAVP
ncbi:MAG: RHS repeat-associated core domain-containing protein [Thermoanaerobaculia bacterium]|nr:RHS repeat-associated core domain-containing protein [Thermoanaerobaculia bacterium]